MQVKTHLIFSALVTAAAAKVGLVEPTVGVVVAAALGCLLPDIDHPSSYIGRRILPVSLLIGGIFGHRGITHSLLAVGVMSAFLVAASMGKANQVIFALALGYLSHLLADWMTNSGVPLMWPRATKYKSPVTVETGSIGEYVIGGCALLLLAMLIR